MKRLFLIFALVSFCAAPAAAQSPERGLVNGNTDFAFALYRQVREDRGNIFFSPYSISTCLGMVYAGARAETAAQMAEVLHFAVEADLHPTFQDLQASIDAIGKNGDVRLLVANALWAQKDYVFLPAFLDLTSRYYDAAVNAVDFAGEAEAVRLRINSWVEGKTNDKIKGLLPPGILTPLTRLVLTNAVYFKGTWDNSFDRSMTTDEYFYRTLEDPAKVPMMKTTGEYGYLEGEGFHMLEMPYAGGDLSMVILLPEHHDGLKPFEDRLNAQDLGLWLGAMTIRTIDVHLPKFTMVSKFKLGKTLAAMGMPDVFLPQADLSGIDGTRELYLAEVIHQAFVDINEEGTEAAAATAAPLLLRALPMPNPQFKADHPFVFLIREKSTRNILFLGRVLDPKE